MASIPKNILTTVATLLQPYSQTPITEGSIIALLAPKKEEASKGYCDAERFLTPNEALKLLHCTRMTLWRYEKRGKIEVKRPSRGKTLISRESIDRLLA